MNPIVIPICPEHGVTLQARSGPFSTFYGCPFYPDCDVLAARSSTGRMVLSTKADRDARKAAHAAFDSVWKGRRTGRSRARTMAYRWLREAMGLSGEDCHIAHMNAEQCARVVELVGKLKGADRHG